MRRCLSLVLLAFAHLGCGNITVWHGRTPDRTQRVEIEQRGTWQSVLVGDVEHRSYHAIAIESLVLSPTGGRVAYAAKLTDRWTVVIDEQAGRWYDAIGDVVMAPAGTSVAFAAFADHEWRVLVDRQPGPAYDAILEDTLRFNLGGSAVYVAERDGRYHVVTHGKEAGVEEGPAFDGIRRLTVGPLGRVAYIGRAGKQSRVVVDGRFGEPYEGIGELVLGRNTHVYTARRPDGWVAVTNGREGPVHLRVDDLRISDRGRVAYVAIEPGGEHLVIADGKTVGRHAHVLRDSLRVGPSGRAAWVVQEDGGQRMVLDGEPGPLLDAVSPAVFAPVGTRWGYIARKETITSVVVDGEPQGTFAWAADLVFSPDGRRYAYAAHARGQDYLAHDHGARAVPRIVVGTIAFDLNSRHTGCIIGNPETRQFHFTVDGKRHKRFDIAELVAHAAADPERFRSDRELMRRWVAAELALLPLDDGEPW